MEQTQQQSKAMRQGKLLKKNEHLNTVGIFHELE